MSFWNRLEKALEENNITASELSRSLGVNNSVVYSWKIRESIPRADIACKAATILNTTVEYLVNGDRSKIINTDTKNTFLVPVLNQELSAGNGSVLPDKDEIKALIELPSVFRQFGENIAALYVNGDSMEPTLKNGTLVVITPDGWDQGEGLYGVELNGCGYVKRIQAVGNKILIISDNPKYKTIEEPIDSQNFKIIGRVIAKVEYNTKGL